MNDIKDINHPPPACRVRLGWPACFDNASHVTEPAWRAHNHELYFLYYDYYSVSTFVHHQPPHKGIVFRGGSSEGGMWAYVLDMKLTIFKYIIYKISITQLIKVKSVFFKNLI